MIQMKNKPKDNINSTNTHRWQREYVVLLADFDIPVWAYYMPVETNIELTYPYAIAKMTDASYRPPVVHLTASAYTHLCTNTLDMYCCNREY